MIKGTAMNKEQKQLLLKEKEELKDEISGNSKLTILGVIIIVIALIFGYIGQGFVLISIELIVGIILIVIGMSRKQEQRLKEINYAMAGNDAKSIKVKKKITKFFCSHCNNEVKDEDVHCKQCKKVLACDGAVRKEESEVEEE